ncbi:hypothetical protein PRIPAC_95681 [Pristionchus pacificus]|uniref:Uncharacterized protein n=1 Tax=Pristionchus pacificus TaxID=54126 RepID=A0A2A6D319_PRIPA|nr:hypothetical protein PRIPAC_95681 [Pristionchus pacificus]|eukprot:PDM84805.1 hypothetical protein PRIPAC_33828 [Pristionchus pacificus]
MRSLFLLLLVFGALVVTAQEDREIILQKRQADEREIILQKRQTEDREIVLQKRYAEDEEKVLKKRNDDEEYLRCKMIRCEFN